MNITYETNEYGEQVIVKTYPDGTVIKELDRPAPPVNPVPQSVSMRQARLALDAAGMLDTVDAALAQASRAWQIEWEFAAEVNRQWPTLLALQPALGMTDKQVDQLFITASQL